jgi:predicted phosphodiesterase
MKKALVLADLHIPHTDWKALSAVEKYISNERWDYIIYLGDFLDLDHISSYNSDSPRKTEGKRILHDYAIANKVLDKHQKLVRKHNKNGAFVLLSGNHSARLEKLLDKIPQLEGLIELKNGLKLEERNFKFVDNFPNGEVYYLGNLLLTHGNYTSLHHAKKMVESYGSVLYGHTHQIQSHTRTRFNKKEIDIGQSIGCLCEYDQPYIKGKPTSWVKSFAVVYFDDNIFNIYPVIIWEDKFVSPSGICYHVNHDK